jgi:hypothetical protein
MNLLRFAFLAACLALSHAALAKVGDAVPATPATLIPPGGGADVVKARDLLDIWSGEDRIVRQAQALLDAELDRNPKNHEALLELARVAVMTMTREGNVQALALIDEAVDIAPDFAYAFVLRGHVLTNLDRDGEAFAALHHAESLGTDSPWLLLNRAVLHARQGLPAMAALECQQVIDSDTTNPKALFAAWDCREPWLIKQRDFVTLEESFRARVEINRTPALLAKFARFLCEDVGRCAEALPFAREAERRGTADSVCGCILTRVLVAVWADAAAANGDDSPQAVALLGEARARDPHLRGAMALLGGNARNANLVRGLLAHGVSIDEMYDGQTALLGAAYLGDVESVQMLLANGADVDLGPPGLSPLVVAAARGHVEVLRILVAAGAGERSMPQRAIIFAEQAGKPGIAAWIQAQYPQFPAH